MSRQMFNQIRDAQLDLAFQQRQWTPLSSEPPSSDCGCPSADLLWSALHGELSELERNKIILHLGSCSACAEDWRIGRKLAKETAPLPSTKIFRRRKIQWGSTMALIAAGIMFVFISRSSDIRSSEHRPLSDHVSSKSPVYRGTMASSTQLGNEIETSTQALSSYRFDWNNHQFSWPSDPRASHYELLIHDLDFQSIVAIENLYHASHSPSPSLLKRLRETSGFYWQIRTIDSSGQKRLSPTFRVH